MKNCQNLENFKLYEMKSTEFYNQLTQEQIEELNIGCIFIDGDHEEKSVKNDIQLAIKLLGNKKGFIFIELMLTVAIVSASLICILQGYYLFLRIVQKTEFYNQALSVLDEKMRNSEDDFAKKIND